MIEVLGNYGLAGAVLLSAVAMLAGIAAARFGRPGPLRAARWSLVGVAGLFAVASAALMMALLQNDFRFDYVGRYSEIALPAGYKLAAFWAGQEGSLLLWGLMVAVMSAMVVVQQRKRTGTEPAITLASLAAVCGFFAALMLFAANPFQLSAHAMADGHGLNPMLQDPGMIAHPPALFLGYAGFTVPLAMMIGALVAGRTDNAWVGGIRRWTIASWLFLTIGIVLGAQWAFVELGWGGYWAWDPVENASLLPWLTGTALLHSMMAQQQRGMLKLWNAGLIAATFILCVFGTYLTRSGVVQSVHSFGASLIGTFFLVFLVAVTLFCVILLVSRRKLLRSEHPLESLAGREGAFLLTNLLLAGMTAVTLVGTIFPLLSDGVTVDQTFYNRSVLPPAMALLALMAAGPLFVYGRDAGRLLKKRMIAPASAGLVAAAILGVGWTVNPWALVAAFVAGAAITSAGIDMARVYGERRRTTGEGAGLALWRMLDSNHRRYGGQTVHVGMLLVMIGVVGSSLFNVKETFQLHPGQTVEYAGRKLTFEKLFETQGPNFIAMEAVVTLKEADGAVKTVHPQRRLYNKTDQPNSEVAIESNLREDLYVTLAGWEDGGKLTALQVVINPLVSWIWIGGIVMTLGAIVCLLPRLEPGVATAPVEIKSSSAGSNATGGKRLSGKSAERSGRRVAGAEQ